jgi:acyl-CoA thioester hydrolase
MARARLDLPSTLPFQVSLNVRIADVNYLGHLGNDAVLGLLNEARIAFLAESGYTEKNIDGVGIIMTDAHVVYRSEAFHGDVLRVEVGVGEFSHSGCDLFYRMSNAASGAEVARAKTGIAFFNYEERKITPVPAGFRERYGRILP